MNDSTIKFQLCKLDGKAIIKLPGFRIAVKQSAFIAPLASGPNLRIRNGWFTAKVDVIEDHKIVKTVITRSQEWVTFEV